MEDDEDLLLDARGVAAGSGSSHGSGTRSRSGSFEQSVAEEIQRVAMEFNLSSDEMGGPPDEEYGALPSISRSRSESPVVATEEEQEQKNWAEFGYDLDDVETPNEVVSQASEDDLTSAEVGVAAGQRESIFAVSASSSSPKYSIVTDRNSKYVIGKADSSTTVTKTSSGEHTPSPAAREHQYTPIKMDFESFLSENGEDQNADDIADIWSAAVRGLGVASHPTLVNQQPPGAGGVNFRASPSENSGDNSDGRIKEHGSILCGVRTRFLILIFAFILCTSLLVVGVTVLVAKTAERGDSSDSTISDAVNIDDLGEANPPDPSTPVVPATADAQTATTAGTEDAATTQGQSPAPTAAPTDLCRDRDSLTFDVNGSTRNCAWLRKSASVDFQLSICQWNVPIRDACRTTCNTCDAFAPTTGPTVRPTGTPSTIGPTVAPTGAPTGAPVTPTSAPTGAPITPTFAPTGLPATNAPTAWCPPDLPGSPPRETYTCDWLALTNSHYLAGQCGIESVRNHCGRTCCRFVNG